MPFLLLRRLLARLVCCPLSFAQQASIAFASDTDSTAYGQPQTAPDWLIERADDSTAAYTFWPIYSSKRAFSQVGRAWLILLTFLLAVPVLAQQTPTAPKVIPPSPEAATLFRFLDYPVNVTGVPDISIPVYEVKSGALSVPITLSYHAGGRRASDETGAAGLGWALHAGGMISRTVYGAPDDRSSFPNPLTPMSTFMNVPNTNENALGYHYFKDLYSESNPNGWDSEYDIFSYYFGNKSGKFILSPDRDSVYLMPQAPLKFSVAFGSSNLTSTVVDEKGNLFEFGKDDGWAAVPGYGSCQTGQLLTRIISANKQDTITFAYSIRSHSQASTVAQVNIVDNNETPTAYPGGQPSAFPQRINTTSIQYSNVQRIKLIKFREGYVKFIPYTQVGLYGRVDTTDQISSIQLLSRQGQLIKTVRLQTSQLGYSNAAPVSKLDQLLFQDPIGATVERYIFDYFPDGTNSNPMTTGGVDFWGYLNGYVGDIIPYYNILVQSSDAYGTLQQPGSLAIGGADKEPHAGAAQSGVLQRITYPTGGSTEFKYEGNRAQRGSKFYECPGLRVAQTITRDSVGGPPQVRTFRYGPLTSYGGESGCGERDYLTTSMGDMSYEMRYFPLISTATPSNPNSSQYNLNNTSASNCSGNGCDFRSYRRRTYSSQFLPGIAELANAPTYYTIVTEYRGQPIGSEGKTVYHYSAPPVDNFQYYPKPQYPGTLPIGGAINGAPSQVRSFWVYATDANLQVPYVTQVNQWNRSQLTEKTEYKYVPANLSYQPVHSMFYTYGATLTKTLRGQHLYQNIVIGSNTSYNHNASLDQYMTEVCHMPLFSFSDYYVTTGRVQLDGTQEVFYNEGNSFTKTTVYTYNDRLLLKSQWVQANGKTLTTQTTYPFDTPTVPVHQQMLIGHLLDYPVEQRTYADQQLLTTTQTQYQAVTRPGATLFTPARVLTATRNDPLQPRVLFNHWDARGNVTDQQQAKGAHEAYQWGYQQRYPVAHVVNAQNQQEQQLGPMIAAPAYGSFWYDYTSAPTPAAQTFITKVTGPVTLQLAFQGGQGSSSSYPRAQPLLLFRCYLYAMQGSSYNQTLYLKTGGPCSSVSASQDNLTFANVPPGTYGLEITRQAASLSPVDCFEAQGAAILNYVYQTGSQSVTLLGDKEFYAETFEEHPARSTSHAQTGKYGSDGNAFTIPFYPPTGRSYVLDWQQWDNGRWVYHREPYAGKTFAAGTYVDDVRVYPVDAQISTYTYEPLVGVTSATDTNGRSTRYEYDAYGRLSRVRNHLGQILSQQQYHYVGRP
jgi:YD repeat-containing protein